MKEVGVNIWEPINHSYYTKNGSLFLQAVTIDGGDNTNFSLTIEQENGYSEVVLSIQVIIKGMNFQIIGS